jgi:hypothetical protein
MEAANSSEMLIFIYQIIRVVSRGVNLQIKGPEGSSAQFQVFCTNADMKPFCVHKDKLYAFERRTEEEKATGTH